MSSVLSSNEKQVPDVMFNDLQQCYLQKWHQLVNPSRNHHKKDAVVMQREGISTRRVIAKLRYVELYHSANIVSRE
uniref:Uncharacterized protein n=1 Tax=Helianthus annuus TaxID=4232 RepID=A0A251RQK4_HELAN